MKYILINFVFMEGNWCKFQNCSFLMQLHYLTTGRISRKRNNIRITVALEGIIQWFISWFYEIYPAKILKIIFVCKGLNTHHSQNKNSLLPLAFCFSFIFLSPRILATIFSVHPYQKVQGINTPTIFEKESWVDWRKW